MQASTRGLCTGHYRRWRRHGDPQADRPLAQRPKLTPVDRFWSKVDRSGTCWAWLGGIGSGGYGRFKVAGRRMPAHRFAYELVVGPIPDGLDLDHLCRVRNCVNPAHLEPVTRRENTVRGISPAAARSRQTHCKRGHPLDDANTYRWRTSRICRTCRSLRDRGLL